MKKKYSPPVIRARRIVFDRLVLADSGVQLNSVKSAVNNEEGVTDGTEDNYKGDGEAKHAWGVEFGTDL